MSFFVGWWMKISSFLVWDWINVLGTGNLDGPEKEELVKQWNQNHEVKLVPPLCGGQVKSLQLLDESEAIHEDGC